MRTVYSCLLLALAVGASHAASAGELVGKVVISTGLQETSASLTPDGRTLYFMRSDLTESDATILESRRVGQGWGTPVVASFSGEWKDSEPSVSPDGKRLYFVSNRPVQKGGEPLQAQMNGRKFGGANIWYVERQANGTWGEPVHIDAELNRVPMVYNPSVAANGNLYFSAHREDSGAAYQLYVARKTADGYAAPERLELGDIKANRMDPAIDPQERFVIYAGNEGDSLGSADIYIAFRQADGSWGKPEHLPGDVNSAALENAPSLGRAFGELFVSSARRDEMHFPKARDSVARLNQRLQEPMNGSRNVWRFDIGEVLRSHGINE